MRPHVLLRLTVCFFCFLVTTTFQTPAQSVRTIPSEVENHEYRVTQVILRAEELFKKGKEWLKKKQRTKAGQEFNRAIDSILESGLDVRSNLRLQTFYFDLVERIYREEVPLGFSTDKAPLKQNVGFQEQKSAGTRNDELSKPIRSEEPKSVVPNSNADNLSTLRLEYLSAVKEYKASLQKLLELYENDLRRDEERVASAKQFHANGMIDKARVEDAERIVVVTREKIASTKLIIANAENQVAMAPLESKKQAKVPSVGPIPPQLANGQVPAVVRYLNDSLNDPYSMKLLKWSKLRIVNKYDEPFWYVTLRLRAKNGFGAYILREAGFYLKNNKVVFTDNL